MTSTPAESQAPLEADSPGGRAAAVREMFSAIAPRYDLLNHLLSLNIDRFWRRAAVNRLGWEAVPGGRYLDLCTGTYDLAVELARRPGFRGHVVAADFAWPMLERGRRKLANRPVGPLCADALCLPIESGACDGAMVAFGLRNLADIGAGLRELRRVMQPGGRLVILDFAIPKQQPLGPLYGFYFRRLLPWIGRLISKHSHAYTYLPESVAGFAEPIELGCQLVEEGYGDVGWRLMSGGIACIWWGTAKPFPDA